MNQHSFRIAVGLVAITGLLTGGLPAWGESGSGGNQGASSSGSSSGGSGGSQGGQEQMHQERMKEQQQSESSLQVRPDQNDPSQTQSQPKPPRSGGGESTGKTQKQRGQ